MKSLLILIFLNFLFVSTCRSGSTDSLAPPFPFYGKDGAITEIVQVDENVWGHFEVHDRAVNFIYDEPPGALKPLLLLFLVAGGAFGWILIFWWIFK